MLFTEPSTATGALLERTGNGHRLTLAAKMTPTSMDLGEPCEVHVGVPRMELDVALALLDELDTPLVFFIDADTDRGRVIYRRYDGHYGTITRADQPLEPLSGAVRSTS